MEIKVLGRWNQSSLRLAQLRKYQQRKIDTGLKCACYYVLPCCLNGVMMDRCRNRYSDVEAHKLRSKFSLGLFGFVLACLGCSPISPTSLVQVNKYTCDFQSKYIISILFLFSERASIA